MVDGMKRGALIGCGFFSRNHLHGHAASVVLHGVSIYPVALAASTDDIRIRRIHEGVEVRAGCLSVEMSVVYERPASPVASDPPDNTGAIVHYFDVVGVHSVC